MLLIHVTERRPLDREVVGPPGCLALFLQHTRFNGCRMCLPLSAFPRNTCTKTVGFLQTWSRMHMTRQDVVSGHVWI